MQQLVPEKETVHAWDFPKQRGGHTHRQSVLSPKTSIWHRRSVESSIDGIYCLPGCISLQLDQLENNLHLQLLQVKENRATFEMVLQEREKPQPSAAPTTKNIQDLCAITQ